MGAVVAGQKAAKAKALEEEFPSSPSVEQIKEYLGTPRFDRDRAINNDVAGVATGLAWTPVGGDILFLESTVSPGTGKLNLTGNLGNVMKESATIALTYLRSNAVMLGLNPVWFTKNDVHVHVPEGATPKDGPSAGIGMCTALVSALTKIPVRSDVAMTGEITLRGEVLPIGGLKEKLLAAHRGGITTVLIPHDNEKDLADIPDNIKGKLDIRTVKWIDEVLEIALLRSPLPKAADRRGDAPAALPALAKGVKAAKGAKAAKGSAKAVVKAAKVAPKRKGVRAH